MNCYAPLFVNVNPGAMQWTSDLIGYDTMSVYGSPAYWAQQMFANHVGDSVLNIAATGVPAKEWIQPTRPPRPAVPGQPASHPIGLRPSDAHAAHDARHVLQRHQG